MKHIYIPLFCALLTIVLCSTEIQAQQLVTGRVVDSQTGEPIPFATVYVSESKGTLTNEEGRFTLETMEGDTISISFMGYKQMREKASCLPDPIPLNPISTTLKEITVISPLDILNKVSYRLNIEYDSYSRQSSNFLLRQAFVSQQNKEMLEAYFNAYSASNLRNIKILNGKRYRTTENTEKESMFASSNLQHLFDFAPRAYSAPFWNRTPLPLGQSFLFNYDIHVEEFQNEDGDSIYAIEFQDKYPRDHRPIMTGTLYVNSQYQILHFEGRLKNMALDTEKDFWAQANATEPRVRIAYTHRRGFTEVEYVACTLEAAGMRCRSIAYNLGKRKIKPAHGKGVRLEGNLLDAIDRAGYDPTLWRQTLIRRTAEEERIAREAAPPGDSTALEMATEAEPPRYRADSLATGSGDFRPLVERLRAFGRTIPQEKVYVHMDNTCYQVGDTIWFSAYTRRTDTGAPSNVSGVLYVELYGQEGYLVERKLIQMRDGQGEGFFALNGTAQYAGLHELRAYTRWQLNWGGYDRKHSPWAFKWFDSRELERAYFRDYAKLYIRVFPVYDRPGEPGDFTRDVTLRGKRRYFRRNRDKRRLTLSLFPEGGGLVVGQPCRMAFEAAWDDGEWVDGWLHCGGDSARVVNRGRGVITLTPATGRKQKVTFVAADGTRAKAELPQADTLGVALRVEQVSTGWRAHLRHTPNLPANSIAMTLMHEGRTVAFSRVDGLERGDDGRTCSLGDSLLKASGVYQLTVFDSRGRVYADRLFFVRHDADLRPTLSVSGLKGEYAPYEPVSLRVKAPQAGGRVSLTVRDDNRRDFLHDNGSILTEMLLSSEIRGFVPQPGWYFERDDRERREALDLLMMTQGWRRFRWQDMAVRGAWELSQPAEQAPVIRGGVYKRNPSFDFFSMTALTKGMSRIFQRDEKSSQPAQPSLTGGTTVNRLDDPAATRTAEEAYEEQERKTARQDRNFALRQQYKKSDRDIKVHSELVSADGTEIAVNERVTRNGRFQIQLPPFYGEVSLFLSAADTTKWSRRKRRKYAWIQGKPYDLDYDTRAPFNKFKKARFDIQPADYLPRVLWPYPRFVSSYSHYQSALARRPERADSLSPFTLDADSAYLMREVAVRARHNGMRDFDDGQPCLIMDAEQAENLTFDAGMYDFARYIVADYGLDYPFVGDPNWEASQAGGQEPLSYMDTRYGITPTRRALPPYRDMLEGVPEDSLYARKYLISFSMLHSLEEARDFRKGIDKTLIYTDYNRRLPGNWRYRGTDLPVTTMVLYPFADQGERMYYRDRHYILQGFAYPAEFYSPDYSGRHLDERPADYRRTLYWNPRLTLDSKGEAEVRFYNCGRTTEPSADAQGQAQDGTPLWSGGDR